MGYARFYKVIVIDIELMESTIISEKHFPCMEDAIEYSIEQKSDGYATMIVHMQ